MDYLRVSSYMSGGRKVYILSDSAGNCRDVPASEAKALLASGVSVHGLRMSGGRLRETGADGEFDRLQMIFLLKRVGALLRERGQFVRITIYGGAAIALTCFDARRSRDIDAVVADGGIAPFYSAVDAVAKRFKLAKTWMNQDVQGIINAIARQDLRRSRTDFGGLSVAYPSTRQLLAMKLFAAREKDVSDAVSLARKLGIRRRETLSAVLSSFFSDGALRLREHDARVKGTIGAMLDAVARRL
jgi:hypothetical protein